MAKVTFGLFEERREEIINACENLYKITGFKDITIKDISKATSFSRPNIYNYFQTKEEIFLALFKREYEKWNKDLEAIIAKNDVLTKDKISEKIARSLEKRTQLLKLLSMNNYDMEANSREEMLRSFKVAYGKSLANVRKILDKFCKGMSNEEKDVFIYSFFPFMFGIYPYVSVTEKQKKAMKDANVEFKYHTIYELINNCLRNLFGINQGDEMI